jgi:2-polyprenyl-3-methyl-5-hydroxy-6-metoxy-1,4-benzoquinol methylase
MSDQNERVLDQFSQQASAYAGLVNVSEAPPVDPLIELTSPQPGEHVLDVGCGTGQFVVKIARQVQHATGMDLTPAMLDQARVYQSRSGVTNVSWQLADSTALPAEDACYDLVVSRSMFHHAADPVATLREMRRVCKPGGRVAVMDLAPDSTKAPAFDAIELLRDPSHARTLTTAELRQLGNDLDMKEIGSRSHRSSIAFESVLSTSFPPAGLLERVRALVTRDCQLGGDAFGLRPELREHAIWVSYPMSIVVWQR